MDDSTSSNGYHALAVQLAETTTFPSWGYMYAQNATTLWEQWIDTYLPSDGASHNHVMFGSIDEWLYDYYAGIRSDGSVDLHYLCDSRTTSSSLVISGDDGPYFAKDEIVATRSTATGSGRTVSVRHTLVKPNQWRSEIRGASAIYHDRNAAKEPSDPTKGDDGDAVFILVDCLKPSDKGGWRGSGGE